MTGANLGRTSATQIAQQVAEIEVRTAGRRANDGASGFEAAGLGSIVLTLLHRELTCLGGCPP